MSVHRSFVLILCKKKHYIKKIFKELQLFKLMSATGTLQIINVIQTAENIFHYLIVQQNYVL
jgi:hypothetical protein